MAQARIRFYIDENLSPEIVTQLRMHGIDVIRGPLGADDPAHLERATRMGRVVCTSDDDFIKLAARGADHAGIIWGEQTDHSVGDWVRYLRLVNEVQSSDEMINTVNYVFYIERFEV